MTPTLKPYPAYKDSGVSWLGKVPEHWEVVPLKRLAWFKSGAGFPVHHQGDASAEVPFFKVSDMNIPGNEKYLRVCANTVSTTVAQSLGATVFPAGTIVFPKVGGALLTNKRRVSANQCCIDNNMMACVARNDNREFLFLVMSYIDLGQFAQPGPVPAINEGEVREIRVALPSAAEQTAIVRFLDYMDRRIKRYINAKQKMIKLLSEYKQALIHQAVTGKIDVRTGKPYPSYKDSGAEWLGKVPEHWEVRRVRHLTNMLVSNIDKHTNENEMQVRLCNYIDVYKNEVINEKIAFMKATASLDEINRFKVKKGDVAITKDSEIWNDIAVPALIEYEADDLVYGYHLAIFRPNNNMILSKYLFRSLQSHGISIQFHVSANGVTRFGLSYNAIKNVFLTLPPLPEQTAIVAYLDDQTEKIDTAIASTRKEIELLREYRERLIADVVTGKVDVREVAELLPEEFVEETSELLEEETAIEETTDETASNEETDDEEE